MTKEKKRCPICGCTEHRWVGCATHWRNHVKNDEGKCELRKKRREEQNGRNNTHIIQKKLMKRYNA